MGPRTRQRHVQVVATRLRPVALVAAPWAEEVTLPDPAQPHWTARGFKDESHLPSTIAVQLLQAGENSPD